MSKSPSSTCSSSSCSSKSLSKESSEFLFFGSNSSESSSGMIFLDSVFYFGFSVRCFSYPSDTFCLFVADSSTFSAGALSDLRFLSGD